MVREYRPLSSGLSVAAKADLGPRAVEADCFVYTGRMNTPLQFDRRALLLAALVLASGCARGSRIYDLKISRDDGCLCCTHWAKTIEATGRFRVSMFDAGDMPTFKRSVGVSVGMAVCHTAMAENYVIEGHVPAADILRLLGDKPKAVLGLVVPGMPRGSPGMEQESGAKDEFIVHAFKAGDATEKFAFYPGNQPT